MANPELIAQGIIYLLVGLILIAWWVYKVKHSQKVLEKDAKDGEDVAGATRKDIEQKLGKSVISDGNFLEKSEEQKRLRYKKGK